jgi:hypothetical protein
MAANLGMNIDWRLKDPGMFNRGIENFSRPDADPTNMEEMQGLLNWQQKMGREDAARTTLSQVDKLKADQKEAEDKARRSAAGQQVSGLSKAMENVINSALPAEQKKKVLASLQTRADAIGMPEGINTMNMATQLEDKAVQRSLQNEQAVRAKNAELRAQGMEERDIQRHEIQMRDADYRVQVQGLDLNAKKYQNAVTQLKNMDLSDQAAVNRVIADWAKQGIDIEGSVDAVRKSNRHRELQIEQLEKANEDNAEFDMTAKQLQEEYELTEGQAEQIRRAASLDAKAARTYLSKMLLADQSKEIPSAAMAGLFKDAALASVQSEIGGFLGASEEEMEALAAKIALKASDIYVNGDAADPVAALIKAQSEVGLASESEGGSREAEIQAFTETLQRLAEQQNLDTELDNL